MNGENQIFAELMSSAVFLVFFVLFIIIIIASNWKIFEKAGEEGWKSIVPFYNSYTLSKIIFGNGWYFLLSFVPFISYIYSILSSWKLGTVFRKSTLFKLGLLFFSIPFYPILAFGNSKYQKYIN